VNDVLDRTDMTWREKLAFLAHRFAPVTDMAVTDCPVKESFENGEYVREIFIPAGTLFIGRPHKAGHRIVGLIGSVVFRTENGPERFDAPFEMVTKPGSQVAAVALTDHIARSYHPAPSEDFKACEDAAFEPAESVFELGRLVDQRVKELACPV